MRRRLRRMVWRVISVGCAVNTGVTRILRSASRIDAGGIPAARKSEQRPAKRAFDGSIVLLQAGSAAAPLAVVGLGKVGEFEINREGFGEAVSVFDRETADDFARLSHQPGFEVSALCRREVVRGAESEADATLDHLEECFALLLDQHAPEQDPERTHVTTQRQFLGRIGGVGSEFRQPGGRIIIAPEGGRAWAILTNPRTVFWDPPTIQRGSDGNPRLP